MESPDEIQELRNKLRMMKFLPHNTDESHNMVDHQHRAIQTQEEKNENYDFKLSGEGLEQCWNVFPLDFSLLMNKTIIQIPKFLAAFLSPKIAQLFLLNPTLSQYQMKYVPNVITQNLIDQFIDFIHGKSISISNENYEFFKIIAKELKNSELKDALNSFIDQKCEINNENCISILKRKWKMNEKIEEEEKYLIKHFESINPKQIEKIPYDLINKIFSGRNFNISNEDILFEKISLMKKEYWYLLKYVLIENLSKNMLKKYLSMIKDGNLYNEIWDALSNNIISFKNKDQESGKWECKNIETFKFVKGEQNGILSHLIGIYKGNLHDKGIITLSANKNCYSEALGTTYFSSSQSTGEDAENQWIQYDFKQNKIQLTHYTIKNNYTYGHIQQWKLLASNNGVNFDTIDTRDIIDPNGKESIKTYNILSPYNQKSYRIFRILQIGRNSNGTHSLCYSGFEFYGSLLSGEYSS